MWDASLTDLGACLHFVGMSILVASFAVSIDWQEPLNPLNISIAQVMDGGKACVRYGNLPKIFSQHTHRVHIHPPASGEG